MNYEVKEGFLCPICLQDLKTPTNLSSHFEEAHQDEKHIIAQLRSVFGKAKRKILKQTEIQNKVQSEESLENVVLSYGTPATGGIDVSLWDNQEIGQYQSHLKLFCQDRKNTIERQVVELNKLLIRLEKLMKSGIYSSESSLTLTNVLKARKNLERQVVPWENDKGVEFCPHCKKRFSLTYRRHHCRLCGRVVCDNCLSNLNMLLPVSLLKLDKSVFMKSNQSEDDYGLRVCDSCEGILNRQMQLCEITMANTVLLQLYEKMTSLMYEANMILPKFLKMADSLNSGETELGLESVTETRLKLLKCYEMVENISKRIQFLGTDKEKQPHVGALRLQRSIRTYASNYLSENMFTLPGLPSKEKYADNLKRKEQERMRIRAEKNLANLNAKQMRLLQNKSPLALTSDNRADPQHVREKNVGSGWGPAQVTIEKASDPILQQIENIRGYIQQAQDAEKFDEIKTLQEHLRDLQLVYEQQQKLS